MIQLTLTLKMTTAQVVETSVTVNNNSPIQDYVHPDDHTQPFYDQLFLKTVKTKFVKYHDEEEPVLKRIHSPFVRSVEKTW